MTESDGPPLLVWQIVERYWAEVTLRHAASQTRRDFRDHQVQRAEFGRFERLNDRPIHGRTTMTSQSYR